MKARAVGKFKVAATKDAVKFWIDHQGFSLLVQHDNPRSPAERLQANRWYARMLRIALKRLAGTARKNES